MASIGVLFLLILWFLATETRRGWFARSDPSSKFRKRRNGVVDDGLEADIMFER